MSCDLYCTLHKYVIRNLKLCSILLIFAHLFLLLFLLLFTLSKPDLEDLLELKPSVGRSLQGILCYEGEDMEGDLSLFFEYVSRVFGEVVRTPLVPGGSSVPVTVHNR